MIDKKSLQEKYYEFQYLDQQIKQVTQQIQELNNKLLELEYIKTALGELGTIKKDSEILAPISSGIFIKAKLKDNDNLLVNVGGSTVVSKNVKEAQTLLDSQISEIESVRQETLAQAQELAMRANSIERQLKELTKEG